MLRIAVADDEPVITKQMERILCKVCGNWELEIHVDLLVIELAAVAELLRPEARDIAHGEAMPDRYVILSLLGVLPSVHPLWYVSRLPFRKPRYIPR